MNKIIIILICFFVSIVFMFSFAGQVKAENIILSFYTGFSKSHIIQKNVLEPWVEELSKLSDRQIRIFFPNNFKIPITKMYSWLEQGYADISFSLQDYSPGQFPMTSIFELPYTVPNAEITSRSMWKAYEKYPDFRKEYAKVKLLALFCHPAAHFHTVVKPIRKITDIHGMKLITTNPYASDALRILGASPVSMPLNEAYDAIDKGLADGILLHWEGLVDFNLHNIIKYSTKAYFSTTVMMVAMSLNKYNSLSKNLQKIVDNTSGLKISSQAGKLYDREEMKYEKIAVNKGIKVYAFSPSDMKKLQSLAIPIREQWKKAVKSKGLSGEKLLEDIIKLESMTSARLK